MSSIDSKQDKEPISSVHDNSSLNSPGKEVSEDHTPSVDSIKGSSEAETVSVQSEPKEMEKDGKAGDDKAEESSDAEVLVNGVNLPVDNQKESELSDKLRDISAEAKPSENHQEVLHDKQVNKESAEVDAGKEEERKESQASDETVAMETNGGESETASEIKDDMPSQVAVVMETSKEQSESSGDIKEAEQSEQAAVMETDEKQHEVLDGGKDSEQSPVAMDMNGEVIEVEVAVSTEVERTETEVEGQKTVAVPVITSPEQEQSGDQHKNQQPTEESEAAAKIDLNVVEKRRSVTIDSPENVKESGKSEDNKTEKGRSKTVGDIESSATSPVTKDATSRSQTIWYTDIEDDTPAKDKTEEAVSYSTSIVGGVVHRMPIASNSPKGQRKSKEGSPQTTPKKRSVIDALFGRRKKSKGGPESPPGSSQSCKDEDQNNKQKVAEASPGSKDAGKKETAESSAVIPDTNDDVTVSDAATLAETITGSQSQVKDTSESAEIKQETEEEMDVGMKGTSNDPEIKQEREDKKRTEVGDTSDAAGQQKAERMTATAEEERRGNVEVKPEGEAQQSQEGDKEGITQVADVPDEVQVEAQEVKVESVRVESTIPEKAKEPEEEQTGNKDSDKEAVKRAHTEPSEEEANSQPSPKKKKASAGIFSGFFARRKSKKTKDLGSASSSAENAEDDKVEGEQDVQPASEGTSADFDAVKGQEHTTSPKTEVAESLISQAVGRTVESVQEELTDKEKVDGLEEETGETAKPEEEFTVAAETPEVSQRYSDVLPSQEADAFADKAAEAGAAQDKKSEPGATQESQINSQQEGKQLTQPKIEVTEMAAAKSEGLTENEEQVSGESKPESSGNEEAEKMTSPESEEAKDEVSEQHVVSLRRDVNPSYSPKTRRMQMRISYAEKDGEGAKEVEVIGTPERIPGKGKTADLQVSCRSLGEADHEGWLSKKGGMLFLSSWKRKWVVLKDGKLYYFKTAFDPEVSGIINMKGVTVAEAPETKKDFCFKCEQPGTKPQVYLFMADSKEEMDKWLRVLETASRGEIIQKPRQNQLSVKDEVVMRRKSGSNSAQRHSSVLAVGGRHDFLEDEEDFKTARRRSMPGSFTKEEPEVSEEEGKKTVVSSVPPPESIEEHAKDIPRGAILTSGADEQSTPSEAPSDVPTAPSDGALTPSDTAPTPSDAPLALIDTARTLSDAPLTLTDTAPTPSDAPLTLNDTAAIPSDALLEPRDTAPALSDTAPTPSDRPLTPSDTSPAPSDAPLAPSEEQVAPAPLVTPPPLEPTGDSQSEKRESNECKIIKQTVTVVVDKVFVGSERVIVESTSSVEASSSELETPMQPSSGDAVPEEDKEAKEAKENSKSSAEVEEETEKTESPKEVESAIDRVDGAVGVTKTESTVTVVETVKSSVETVKTSTVVDTAEKVEPSSQQISESEVKEEVAQSEASFAVPLESEPQSPSKTKWYFSLDRKQAWTPAPEPEDETSPKRPKSSDRGSIKSTSSDKESIASTTEEDQLMVMCRNIKRARLSIYGEPVVDSAERLRAFSNAKGNEHTLLRLRTLERILKDKEQHLSDLEELLSQPQINRRSIYEWKLRNSDLLEELFPQQDIDLEEGVENVAEGGKDETKNHENAGIEDGEIGQSQNVEDKEEKLDKASEDESASKEETSESVTEKESTEKGENKIEEVQKSTDDEQQLEEKLLDEEQETILEKQESPSESTAGENQGQEKGISAEEQQEDEDKLDTYL